MADARIPESRPAASPGGAPEGDELDAVLRRVNQIRVEHGADPIYELPSADPAMAPGSTCVLQEAFAEIGVSTVDYYQARGPGIRVEHGLSWFVRRFDEGAYPQLVRSRP